MNDKTISKADILNVIFMTMAEDIWNTNNNVPFRTLDLEQKMSLTHDIQQKFFIYWAKSLLFPSDEAAKSRLVEPLILTECEENEINDMLDKYNSEIFSSLTRSCLFNGLREMLEG